MSGSYQVLMDEEMSTRLGKRDRVRIVECPQSREVKVHLDEMRVTKAENYEPWMIKRMSKNQKVVE